MKKYKAVYPKSWFLGLEGTGGALRHNAGERLEVLKHQVRKKVILDPHPVGSPITNHKPCSNQKNVSKQETVQGDGSSGRNFRDGAKNTRAGNWRGCYTGSAVAEQRRVKLAGK